MGATFPPAIAAAFLSVVCLSLGEQQPAQGQRGGSQDGGEITGTVLVREGQQERPVPRALVAIPALSGGAAAQTVTDNDGRFRFYGLRAGSYRMRADRPGLLPTWIGQETGAADPGVPIALTADNSVDVTLHMTRPAVLAGAIRDPAGRGLADVGLRLFTIRRPGVLARATMTVLTETTTDDRGAYRFSGLPAGRYIVVAMPKQALRVRAWRSQDLDAVFSGDSGRLPLLPPEARLMGYASWASGGPTRDGDFNTIVVEAGEERNGIDGVLLMAPLAQVSGRVLLPEGALTRADLALRRMGELLSDMPGTPVPVVSENGRFQISGLPPGSYSIRAQAAVTDRNGRSTDFWGDTAFDLAGRDLGDVSIDLAAGATLVGSFTKQGKVSTPMTGTSLALVPVDGDFAASRTVRTAEFTSDRAFLFRNVPKGRYFLRCQNTVDGRWYLHTASQNGTDLTTTPIEVFDSNPTPPPVSVTLTTEPTRLGGLVVTGDGLPTSTAGVLAFSTDRSTWRAGSGRISPVVQPSHDGSYSILGLPEGDYFVVALPTARFAAGIGIAELADLAQDARRVHLMEFAATRSDLTLPIRK